MEGLVSWAQQVGIFARIETLNVMVALFDSSRI